MHHALVLAISLLCTAALAHGQLFNPSSRGGLGQVGVAHGSTIIAHPVDLSDWHWTQTVSYDGTGLPLPCGTAFAGLATDTTSNSNSLTIAMAGEVGSSGLVNDCGSYGESRAQEEWNFSVSQPTCFTMTVTTDNPVNTGAVDTSGAFLLIGYMTLTVGTLDAPSGIFRNIPSNTTATYTFAGTLLGGSGYTVRLSGRAASQTNPASGTMHQTLTLTLFPCPPACDSIDFNGDTLFPDTQDIDDFITVFSGGVCSTGTCGDIDFNNDGLFPDTADIDALLSVFSGGSCI